MNIANLKVGFLSGTGPEGRGLALRWAKAGASVTIGSRALARASDVAAELNRMAGTNIAAAENRYAVSDAEFVILTVPFEHAAAVIAEHNAHFSDGAILIDSTVPVVFEKGVPRYVELAEGSGSEHLRTRLDSRVELITAFKTIPAHLLSELEQPLDCDDFVAGGSREARSRVMAALAHLGGLRPIDAGGLESARVIERMTLLAIHLNRRYKVKTARYRMVGL